MENRAEVSYYYGQEHILTTITLKVPEVGECIYFNTKMSQEWYDARFSDKKLFHNGVRGKYTVQSVDRFYKNYDYVAKVEREYHKTLEFPCQYTIETFEVQLKPEEI